MGELGETSCNVSCREERNPCAAPRHREKMNSFLQAMLKMSRFGHAQTLWMYLGSNVDAQTGLFPTKTLIILGSFWYPTLANAPVKYGLETLT